MKTRAAVCHQAGQPLVIETVDLDGPEGRRSPGRNQGHRRLPHGRLHALRGRPGGAVPSDLRPRGCRHRRGRGPRREIAEERGSRDPALHTRVSRVQELHVAQDEPVYRNPLHPGPGRDAGRHQPLLTRRRENPSLHGLLDILQLHRAAGDRGCQGPCRCALRQDLLHRLRRDHRDRCGHQHSQGRAGRQRRRLRPSGASVSTSSRARDWPAPTRSWASTSIRPASAWPRNSA